MPQIGGDKKRKKLALEACASEREHPPKATFTLRIETAMRSHGSAYLMASFDADFGQGRSGLCAG